MLDSRGGFREVGDEKGAPQPDSVDDFPLSKQGVKGAIGKENPPATSGLEVGKRPVHRGAFIIEKRSVSYCKQNRRLGCKEILKAPPFSRFGEQNEDSALAQLLKLEGELETLGEQAAHLYTLVRRKDARCSLYVALGRRQGPLEVGLLGRRQGAAEKVAI